MAVLRKMHVLVFSERRNALKRVSVSRIGLYVGGLLVTVAVLASALSLWGANYYYSGVVAANPGMSSEDKQKMMAQLDTLYQEIARDERLLDVFQSTLEIDTGEIEGGKGPVPQQRKKVSGKISDKGNFVSFLETSIEELKDRRLSIEDQLDQLYDIHTSKMNYQLAVPAEWPVRGWLTSGFGFRRSPITGASRFHSGLDIASPFGTQVLAPSDGIVMFKGWRPGYGQTIILDHGFGFQTVYGHTARIFVNEGDAVKRGAKIASVGSSGRSTGPHLHYEVHVDGVPTNPLNYIHDILE